MPVNFLNYLNDTYQYPNKSECNITFGSLKLIYKSSKRIDEVVLQSKNKHNKIGRGSEGTVYRIPGTEYCLKVFRDIRTKVLDKWTRKISEEEKVNHVLMKKGKKMQIMKYLNGKSLEYKIPDEVYSLPESSYRNLLRQISSANRCGMYFDHIPSNIIYNPDKKSLTAIDFYRGVTNDLRCYQPYSQVFLCLKTDNRLNNAKLGKKLLNIAVKEFLHPEKAEIYTTREDVLRMLHQVRQTQKNLKAEDFDNIRKLIVRVSVLKQRESFGEINREQLLKRTKELRKLINSTFSTDNKNIRMNYFDKM